MFIKVPATPEGVEAFRELTAAGVSVNVTLLFAVERYEEIANAWIDGLERRVAAGEPVDRLASVASFFVSRVDTKVDARLEELGRADLQGMAAVANAKLAYRSFQRIFSGPRWEALAAKGAHVQRPLWASTSTKNPAYPDTLYVDTLIGPDTVNTMPEATIDAARDHGVAGASRSTRRSTLAEAHMRRARAHRRRPRPDPRARARRRGRRVVRELVRLADRDDRREGARSWHRRRHEHGSGGRAPVRARRLALDELRRGRVAGLDRRRRRARSAGWPSCSPGRARSGRASSASCSAAWAARASRRS